MCGIWAHVLSQNATEFTEADFVKHAALFKANARRGPDQHTTAKHPRYHMAFDRLAIHDMSALGNQPFREFFPDGSTFIYMCNGEIYNYEALVSTYALIPTSQSDCEVIGKLFKHFNGDFARVVAELDGEFAIVGAHININGNIETVCVARDPFGVRPLYYRSSPNGYIFSSLLAGTLDADAYESHHVPPGEHWVISNVDGNFFVRKTIYFDVRSLVANSASADCHKRPRMRIKSIVADALIDAVAKRLRSDRKVGFMLSGGLDSSLVVAIASKLLGKKVRTFSIGMPGGTDLAYARRVAEHLGTEHTEVHFTPAEGIRVIPEVIRAIETYDITTVRASVGQYLLAQHISKETDVKVILNGDGSDEAMMGYLYNYFQPSDAEGHEDSIRLLQEIHCFDGLRVDRTLSHHGLEARVPFLDPAFVDLMLWLPAEWRSPKPPNRIEKEFIRQTFDTLYPNLLPQEVLWRKKEAFSDGVSQTDKSWSTMIQEWVAENHVSEATDEEMKKHIVPHTQEGRYYRDLFDAFFPNQAHIVPHYWLPKWTDCTDPSARHLSVYT